MDEKTQDAILTESIEYIKTHMQAESHDIPLDLIEKWMSNEQKSSISTYRFSVFLYVVTKCAKEAGMDTYSKSIEELTKLYSTWQGCLFLIYVDRTLRPTIKPYKMFDIKIYEEMSFELYPI